MAGTTYTVTRSKTIEAPPGTVYSHLVDFRRWAAWSPWEDLDPAMKKAFTGADSGVGSRYAWSGNRKAGEGSMEITDTNDLSSVTIALEFLKPFKSQSTTSFTLTPSDGGTDVTWAMTGPNTLIMRVMGIFKSMDAMIGPDFEKGLERLKVVSESK